MIVFLNGEWLPAEQARVSIDDRGLLFADGVFETALLFRGGWFRLDEHLERFRASAALWDLAVPALAELRDIAHRLARENRLADGSLRIVLTRGTAAGTTLFATLHPTDEAWNERALRGWTLITAQTRRPSTAAVPAQLKALGRPYAILARLEAARAAADDALLLTDHGDVCEGPAWNVFWRTGDTLFTPDLELGVLAGVTRTVLLDLAPGLGYHVRTGAFPRESLEAADEIFATMTSVGIVSIRALDGRALPGATPAADRLRAAYWEVVARDAGAE